MTDRLPTKEEVDLINHPDSLNNLIKHKEALDPKTSKEGKRKVCSKALHPEFSYPLITVAEMSIEKGYEPLNWLDPKNKVTATYLIEAAQRHLDKVKLGIDINNEEKKLDGTPCENTPLHAAQVAYNMLMLCLQIEEKVLIDDRLFKYGRLKPKEPSIDLSQEGFKEFQERIKDLQKKLERKSYISKVLKHLYPESWSCKKKKCTCPKEEKK